ncbi:hypothetical protein LXL04_029691 [Taraxacum kok-saghyz]
MDIEASMGCVQMQITDLINWIEDKIEGVKQKKYKTRNISDYAVRARAQGLRGRAFGPGESQVRKPTYRHAIRISPTARPRIPTARPQVNKVKLTFIRKFLAAYEFEDKRLVLQEMTPEAHVIATRYTKNVIKSCVALSYVEAQTQRMTGTSIINVPNEIIHGIKKQTLNLKEVDKDANFGGKGDWLTSKRKICLNVDSPQQFVQNINQKTEEAHHQWESRDQSQLARRKLRRSTDREKPRRSTDRRKQLAINQNRIAALPLEQLAINQNRLKENAVSILMINLSFENGDIREFKVAFVDLNPNSHFNPFVFNTRSYLNYTIHDQVHCLMVRSANSDRYILTRVFEGPGTAPPMMGTWGFKRQCFRERQS